MKKLLFLFAFASIPLFSTEIISYKIYVKENNITMLEGKPVVRPLYNLGFVVELTKDDRGFYFIDDEIIGETFQEKGKKKYDKSRYSYHYCGRCDQEFFTDRTYKNHDCHTEYYPNRDRNKRICNQASQFDRESEFNRPSEFDRW